MKAEAHPENHYYADRVKAERGQVVIISAQGFPLWQLPVEEAGRMTVGELRCELRYAAGVYGVAARDLWAAFRAAKDAG